MIHPKPPKPLGNIFWPTVEKYNFNIRADTQETVTFREHTVVLVQTLG